MFSPVSVCLLTGLLKNYCSNLYEILWEWLDPGTNQIWSDLDPESIHRCQKVKIVFCE